MITDIPTEGDFAQSGKIFLNLAWDIVSNLYLVVYNTNMDEWDNDGAVSNDFWAAAQRPLCNAIVLIEQGIELLLKSTIAAVSPYLLLADSPSNWPANCQERDVPFSEFRTVDAHDLPKLYNTTRCHRLDPTFSNRIKQVRKMRNRVIHTVAPSLRLAPTEIWKWILEASTNLIGEHFWITTRRQYLEETPLSVVYDADDAPGLLAWEALKLLDVLSPKEKKQHLGVDSRRRWYACVNCTGDYQEAINPDEPAVNTCQLRPGTPGSTRLYCFVCDEECTVVRKKCPKHGCPGNVMDATDGVCLTCMEATCKLS